MNKPYFFKDQQDIEMHIRNIPIVNRDLVLLEGYKLVNTYFVDSSGFGSENEPALTFSNFLDKIKIGYGYGIIESGQFQVYIGEFEKNKDDRFSKIKALKPVYDARKSFYNKAMVIEENHKLQLLSYETIVAEIDNKKAVVYGDYSNTTLRHIKDFLKQNGFKAESKKQILEDYKPIN